MRIDIYDYGVPVITMSLEFFMLEEEPLIAPFDDDV